MKRPSNIFLFLLGFIAFTFMNCRDDAVGVDPTIDPTTNDPSTPLIIPAESLTSIEASVQRQGDPIAGEEYLLTGDFVDSGIPLDIFLSGNSNPRYDLNRTGINNGVDHRFNAFVSENGVEIASPNCFQCHSAELNDELIIGLGNSEADFTIDQSTSNAIADILITSTYGINSDEYEAYEAFAKAARVTAPNIVTETVGSNPADKIAALLAAHRDPVSLEWSDEAILDVPMEVVPTDVPPWWNLKKKNSMFYTSVGRGDFARISMASSVLTIKDTIKAREIDNQFADVIAYINTLEPPAFPNPINNELAIQGEDLFLTHCSGCHGTYGQDESYPNLLVDLDLVQTDSLLIYANFGFSEFTDWYNSSWFGQEPNAARLERHRAYIAPPLDGIWATAPYLHNGSVPDLISLLNSETRPEIWIKTGVPRMYNYKNVGWEYEVETTKSSKYSYDTGLPGYSNAGHTFGDQLNDSERSAVLEYLKTI